MENYDIISLFNHSSSISQRKENTLSEKRRDNKNRILRENELQKPDGRYEYRYVGADGVRRSVYSWRLTTTDKTPPGKRDKPPLRKMEEEINKDLMDGLAAQADNLTVYDLCEKYILTKINVTKNTQAQYKTVLNVLRKHPFGKRKIKTVRTMEAKEFLIRLQQDEHRGYSSIHNIRGVLRPAFQMATENDLIRKNPFEFQLADTLINDSVKRQAVTKKQMRQFLDFVKQEAPEYWEAIYILFHTGLRISEFCGLTLSDLDLRNKKLKVDHQLQRDRDGTLYVIDGNLKESTKTPAGVRTLPLTDEVVNAFKAVIKRRECKIEPSIDGYTGFIWLNPRARKGLRPMVGMDWEHIFKRLVNKYNSIYRVQLPAITPHVCRHTYSTIMAVTGVSPKTLQYLMGHSDISVTLNVYTHIGFEDAAIELKKLHTGTYGF